MKDFFKDEALRLVKRRLRRDFDYFNGNDYVLLVKAHALILNLSVTTILESSRRNRQSINRWKSKALPSRAILEDIDQALGFLYEQKEGLKIA